MHGPYNVKCFITVVQRDGEGKQSSKEVQSCEQEGFGPVHELLRPERKIG